MGVARVAVAHQDAVEGGPDAALVDGLHRALAYMHRRQVLGAGHVQIAQGALGTGAGLVRVRHRSRSDQLPHPGQKAGLQQAGGPAAQRGHPATGDWCSQQGGQHGSGPANGKMVGAHQPSGPRHQRGAVLHPSARPGRDVTDRGGAAAGAGPRYDLVLGDVWARRRRRGVEDLVTALVEDRGIGQRGTAPAAGPRIAADDLVRILDPLQCAARGAVLLTRAAPRAGTRGPLRRWLGKRSVRGRRLRGVRRVLAQLTLQLGNPRDELLDQLSQGRDRGILRRQQEQQLLARRLTLGLHTTSLPIMR